MRIMKRAFVSGFACAVAAGAMVSFAQDDLDSLLSDLESDGKKKSAPAAVKPAEEVAPKPVAEEVKPVEAVPALEEVKPVEEPKAEAAPVAVEPAPAAEEPKAEAAPLAVAEPAAAAEAAPVAAEASAPVAEAAPAVAEAAPVKVEPVAQAAAEEAPKVAVKPDEKGASEKDVANFLSDLASVPGEVKPALPPDPNAALVSDLMAAESLRREAMDVQAARELTEARAAMSADDWDLAHRKYSLAFKHLNDRADTVELRQECAQGMAEARYQAGRQALREGNREAAMQYAVDAKTLRHPRAQTLIEAIEGDPTSAVEKDVSEIAHRRNDKDYKANRDSIRRRLRRSAQYLAVADLDKALEECELVIRFDPYNSEALALRQRIQRRREVILDKERNATREGMIADVNAAWRPVYAVNSLELKGIDGGTTRSALGNDAERTMEQVVEKRMKEMILPSISFRPPATIADAVEYFKQASRDFDRPEIPIDQRGFNFVLDLGKQLVAQGGEAAPAADSGNDFAASAAATDDASASAAPGGMPVIPAIAANNVSLWDALKLVCRVTKFKFVIEEGPVVMVMPEGMTTEALVTRTYDVTENFAERMSGAAEDVQDMAGGFGGANKSNSEEASADSQEASWKKFFTLMGVKWAEGSSIVYLKTIGKLRVTNTKDQLAVIEAALAGELGATPKLIEIEARFVEVAQEDLNSLGFEWLLNSDYSLGTGKLGKLLGVRGGKWGSDTHKVTEFSNEVWKDSGIEGYRPESAYVSGKATTATDINRVTYPNGGSVGETWSRSGGNRNIGISGDPSTYQNGMRYLSTQGNHISGEGKSVNDNFMRVNAFLGNADLSMILHMLSQRSDTDLLSAPKVLTGPGKEATMKVVTEYIYPTEYDVQLTASGGGSSGGSSSGGGSSEILAVVEPENFTMREVGVILQVTPELSQGGQLINLHLHPQVVSDPTWKNYGMRIPKSSNSQTDPFGQVSGIIGSMVQNLNAMVSESNPISDEDLDKYRNMIYSSADSSIRAINSGANTLTYYDAPMEQPFFKTRSIETDITIANGATVVMGGLITEERKSMEDKIPYLGDIPWIGRFFRSRSEWSNKRNLLIFVTARLVDPMGRQISMGVSEAAAEAPEAKVTPAPEG